MDALQKATAVTALQDMVAKGRIDICAINAIIAMAGVVPDKRAHQIISLLHCVYFKDMHPLVRDQLPDLIRQVIGGEPLEWSVDPPEVKLPEQHKSSSRLWLLLRGK